MALDKPRSNQELFGSCLCERNQYIIRVPSSAAVHQVQVFFDNSAVNRRAQAAPVTAWLQVPLAWYSSYTVAQFEDESHALIKRTFLSPPTTTGPRGDPHHRRFTRTRRQFCGFCGTHLSKLQEETVTVRTGGSGEQSSVGRDPAEYIDVTLGSLEEEAMETLRGLGVLLSEDEDEDAAEADDGEEYGDYGTKELRGRTYRGLEAGTDDASRDSATALSDGLIKTGGMINDEDHITPGDGGDGLVKGDAMINDEDHVPVAASADGLVKDNAMVNDEDHIPAPRTSILASRAPHQMHHRGMPFFESMVENSHLGRIRRRKGGHTSHDGSVNVQWEIIEIGDDHPAREAEGSSSEPLSKRPKLAS